MAKVASDWPAVYVLPDGGRGCHACQLCVVEKQPCAHTESISGAHVSQDAPWFI